MNTSHATAALEITETAKPQKPRAPRPRRRMSGPEAGAALAEAAADAELLVGRIARLALAFDEMEVETLDAFDTACEQLRDCGRRAAAAYASAEGWQRIKANGHVLTVETEQAVLVLRLVEVRPPASSR